MASSAMLQVFGQPASTDVARVMACLLERQLEFELVRTDTFKRGRNNKLPELVKMRARSQSPPPPPPQIPGTYAGTCARSSRGGAPGTCTARARIEQWLQAEAHSFDAPSSALVLHLALSPATAAESERQLLRVLDVYDGALGRSAQVVAAQARTAHYYPAAFDPPASGHAAV
ncbi:hypothetical protein ZEAMMB73_Zm00001d047379 [Zea mays]|uniref:glutathione transferase n=1 Tax=Zea mays TaxID=4577 RepID=A0A1D6P922_MAIZE|nr:hypothetical protein ZEAMMB73_Zm00001d047379 [Zea mays]